MPSSARTTAIPSRCWGCTRWASIFPSGCSGLRRASVKVRELGEGGQVYPANPGAQRRLFRGGHRGRAKNAFPTSWSSPARTATSGASAIPTRFGQILGPLDLHLFSEGQHWELYKHLGAHVTRDRWRAGHQLSRVGAECAARERGRRFQSLGRPRASRCASCSDCGVWEIFLPGIDEGTHYKFEVKQLHGARSCSRAIRSPFSASTARRLPRSSSISTATRGTMRRGWRSAARRSGTSAPVSIYEVHLGSWRRKPEEGDRFLSYRELADELLDYVHRHGLHAHRADAGGGASLRGLVGLPGHRLLRADQPLWQPGRVPLLRRSRAPERHRHHPRLGARAFPEGRARPRGIRRHRPLRACRSAARRAHGLGHAHLQLRPQRGAQFPHRERALLVRSNITSTACAWMRWPRCSISITHASPANGCRTSTAAAKTSTRSIS